MQDGGRMEAERAVQHPDLCWVIFWSGAAWVDESSRTCRMQQDSELPASGPASLRFLPELRTEGQLQGQLGKKKYAYFFVYWQCDMHGHTFFLLRERTKTAEMLTSGLFTWQPPPSGNASIRSLQFAGEAFYPPQLLKLQRRLVFKSLFSAVKF